MHHAMKTYWWSGGIALRILDIGTRWKYLASRPGRFTPREKVPSAHWIGGWVGPRAILDAAVKRKIPSPHRESNPRTPIVRSVQSLKKFCIEHIIIRLKIQKIREEANLR
jgi:hypothetical protein